MKRPDFIFVTGCNAAGKSSLIRTRMSDFFDYEVIMTDVYKGRSQEIVKEAIKCGKNILLETPFNEESFKNLIDLANNAGYQSSLIVLFLKSPEQSFERVAARNTFEKGLFISEENVKYNFIENFKNVSRYFFYFDESFFVYTGEKGKNDLIMKFQHDKLTEYKSNDFHFIQKFAGYSFNLQRLDQKDVEIIRSNKNYHADSAKSFSNETNKWFETTD